MIKHIITGVVILVLALLIFSYITSPSVKSKISLEFQKIKDDLKEGFENAELKGKQNNPTKELEKDDERKKEVIEPPKKEEINEECIKRVKKIVGDSFIIEYWGTLTATSKRIEYINSIFPENNEHFNSKSGHFSGYAISASKTTKRNTISENFIFGKEKGEYRDWIYGLFEYEYDYTLKEITDSNGIILGDNHFTIIVKVDDLKEYYPESINVEYHPITPENFKGIITLKTEDIMEITSCNFVN